jgi:hypothetical protein
MHVGDRLMKQKGWKVIAPHSLPAAKTVNTVSFIRSETRRREGAECREHPWPPAGGEIFLLTFLFIEQLTSLMERFGATKNGSRIGKRLKEMVGTTGLEPATSTVSR